MISQNPSLNREKYVLDLSEKTGEDYEKIMRGIRLAEMISNDVSLLETLSQSGIIKYSKRELREKD